MIGNIIPLREIDVNKDILVLYNSLSNDGSTLVSTFESCMDWLREVTKNGEVFVYKIIKPRIGDATSFDTFFSSYRHVNL